MKPPTLEEQVLKSEIEEINTMLDKTLDARHPMPRWSRIKNSVALNWRLAKCEMKLAYIQALDAADEKAGRS